MNKELIVCGLIKSFNGNTIISDINFRVSPGEMLLIQGRNGVGKTTLFNLIMGNIRLDEGQILLGETNLCRNKYLKKILGIFKTSNNRIAIHAPQVPKAFNHLTTNQCFKILNIEYSKNPFSPGKLAGQLSGGQKKILSLSMVLNSCAEILLLDEPEANLDIENSATILSMIEKAKNQNKILITSAHNPSDVLIKLSDKRFWLKNGTLHNEDRKLNNRKCEIKNITLLSKVFKNEDSHNELRVSDLSVYRDNKVIIKGVSFTASKGYPLIIRGGNGSGKTTLALGLFGIAKTKGNITLDNNLISELKSWERKKIGISLAPQAPSGIINKLTVKENIEGATFNKDHNYSTYVNSIKNLYPQLSDHWNQPAEILSGGYRRLLSILMGLGQGTQVLILDEPLAGLDSHFSEEISRLLYLISKNMIVIIFEHQYSYFFEENSNILDITNLTNINLVG